MSLNFAYTVAELSINSNCHCLFSLEIISHCPPPEHSGVLVRYISDTVDKAEILTGSALLSVLGLPLAMEMARSLKDSDLQDEAVSKGIEALKYEEENPDKITRPKIYNSLAGVYTNMGQKEKGVEYYQTALDLFRENKDSSSQVLVLANLAGINFRDKDNRNALKSYFSALDLAKRVSGPEVISKLNRDICLTYMFLNKIDS